MPSFRAFRIPRCVSLLLLLMGIFSSAAMAQQKIVVEDLKGRKVTLNGPAKRILIDDGRVLLAMALIHKDPVSLLAAWPRDINRLGTLTYQSYLKRFPKLAEIPQVASSATSFSVEKAIASRPDVALISLNAKLSDAEVRQCEAAGIRVVHLDFFIEPFKNSDKSLLILGEIIGRRSQADEFIRFRQQKISAISSKLGSAVKRPKVFLEVHAGMTGECCNAPGKGNIGEYISFVGGHNIAADVLPGATGKVNLEYVIAQDPKVYIATGGPHLEKAGGLVVGPGYTTERARASLEKISERPGLGSLSAVQRGDIHGLSHQLLNSPLDLLAVEALAKWIHPELFGSLDPAATMAEINRQFLAVPMEGTNWIDLR
jgi:iron complex transport system substrate-binding protein